MPSRDGDTTWLMVVDDNDSTSTWTARLRDDTPAGTPRFFTIFGDVCASALAARARLLPAIQGDYLPDLILIDQVLQHSAESASETGLGLMRWLSAACVDAGRDVPPCVLWSVDYEPGLAYAFVLAGGTQAFQRNVAATEFLGRLWRVVDHPERRWTHRFKTPRLDVPPTVASILPFLEAGWGTLETGTELRRRGVIGDHIADARDWVVGKRSKLQQTCNAHAKHRGQPEPFLGQGYSAALADYALEYGQIWVPLKYEDSSPALR